MSDGTAAMAGSAVIGMFITYITLCVYLNKCVLPLYFPGNFFCRRHKDYHFSLNVLLHYCIKFENKKCCRFQQHQWQIVDMFSSMSIIA